MPIFQANLFNMKWVVIWQTQLDLSQRLPFSKEGLDRDSDQARWESLIQVLYMAQDSM